MDTTTTVLLSVLRCDMSPYTLTYNIAYILAILEEEEQDN